MKKFKRVPHFGAMVANSNEKKWHSIIKKFGIGYFFADPPKNQPSWNTLTRIIFAEADLNVSRANIKAF